LLVRTFIDALLSGPLEKWKKKEEEEEERKEKGESRRVVIGPPPVFKAVEEKRRRRRRRKKRKNDFCVAKTQRARRVGSATAEIRDINFSLWSATSVAGTPRRESAPRETRGNYPRSYHRRGVLTARLMAPS